MNGLFYELFEKCREYQDAFSYCGKNKINITGLTDTAKPHFLCGIFEKSKKNILVVVKNEVYAKYLSEMLMFFDVNSYILRGREFNFYNIDARSNELYHSRLATLCAAKNKERAIYITTLEALTEPVMPKETLEKFTLTLNMDDEIEPSLLSKKLTESGYTRTDMVEFKGQYSLRGDVLDVYDPLSELPYRIEFFGDTIDSIRSFDEKTQLSVDKLDSVTLRPASEIVFDEETRLNAENEIRKVLKKKLSDKLKEELKSDLEKLINERTFPGLDKYISLIYDEANFFSYMDKDDLIVIDEPLRINENKEAVKVSYTEALKDFTEREIYYGGFRVFLDTEKVCDELKEKNLIGLMSVLTSNPFFHAEVSKSVTVTDCPTYYGKINLLTEDIINYKKEGYTVILPCGNKKVSNFKAYFENESITTEEIYENSKYKEKGIYLLRKNGVMGFCYPLLKFIMIYDSGIFGENINIKKKKKSDKDTLSFSDLHVGDYVVHSIHGIGKYLGTEKLEVENIRRDFLKIKYQGTDVLYVPVDQLESLNKYVGAGEHKVKLNKLGGQEFARIKERVRKSCAELADKLIKLYGERERTKGHKFMPDTDMQTMFEQTFPYVETEDQLRSIKEVKEDMESDRPMDRLLCGDVGYGKTEVALRAAFKCAAEGKQTAYLAATTVLAEQHYNTFKSRMENFPVNCEMLSRFRTKKQQTKILKDLKEGTLDIIIGTHRLLSKDVEFKDLGLLIIDEEQRFGVAAKEKLKEMKKNVEVLTLTATPIPRTLHMSMLGIRDMSVLKDPPQDRFPVQTYVTEYNEKLISNAISKELSRGGQVFYLYNNTEDIFKVAEKVSLMCPGARVDVAHGQMTERAIEKAFIEMLNGNTDVLVCTTIIETGIDIANANTIIIENSDRLGLSQLYQLRGRVGRSNRLAYCYLTYRKDKVLTEQSESRLKTIKEFTEFGSGFKIALRDLEIRGAGNVLGAEQHGHMDSVGYDMYMKILGESIKDKKGEKKENIISCRVDIKENAYIPEDYIENHDIRMDMYKKIANIKTKEASSDMVDELIDRFSDPPLCVLNLIDIAYIKGMAEKTGIFEILDSKGKISFSFSAPSYMNLDKISKVAELYKGKIMILAGSACGFSYRLTKEDVGNKLNNIKNILQIIG